MPRETPLTLNEIATRRLWAVCPKRGGFEVTIKLGSPYRASDVDWACPVGMLALHEGLADQHGVDSWQALVLAQSLARTLLLGFVEDGGRLFDSRGGDSVDVNSLFERGI